MAITYDSGTNIITVTGYTEATPCNFTDIYDADVAGAWGKVTRQCTNQFCFTAKLVIGDGSIATWFADIEKHITLNNIINSTWDKFINVKNLAHFRVGVLNDLTTKSTKQGCSFLAKDQTSTIWLFIKGDTTSDINIYSTQFISIEAGDYAGWLHTRNANNHIWNCLFCGEGAFNGITGGGIGNFYNLTIQDGFSGLAKAEGVFEQIIITGCTHGIHWYTNFGADVKNAVISDCINSFDLHDYSANYAAINFVCNWVINWVGTSTGTLYRKYEFDLKVIDKDNTPIQTATVKIYDKDSNLIVDTTTDVNGDIATQTISRGYYNQANGNTLQEYSPHLITIEKAGYTTYEADFTLGVKTDWTIALQGVLKRNPAMTGGMV